MFRLATSSFVNPSTLLCIHLLLAAYSRNVAAQTSTVTFSFTLPRTSPAPTPGPTPGPTTGATPSPTQAPTGVPTHAATQSPTAEPTRVPTAGATPLPTAEPTPVPTTPAAPLPERQDIFIFGNSLTLMFGFAIRVGQFFSEQWNAVPSNDRPEVDTPGNRVGGANLGTHLNWMQDQWNFDRPDFSQDGWAWCIIQDQSITPAVPQWRFNNNWIAGLLADYCHDGNVKVMYMMTWGYRYHFTGHGVDYDFLEMTDELFIGYDGYVQASSPTPDQQAYMAPCGLVWELIYQDCLDEGKAPTDIDCMWKDLYNDGVHQSEWGSTMCAMTFAVSMTGITPYKLYYNPHEDEYIGGKLVQDIMRDAVYRVITETYDSGKIKYPFDEPLEPRDPDEIWRAIPTSTTKRASNLDEQMALVPKVPSPFVPSSQLKMFFLGTGLVVDGDFLEDFLVQTYEKAFPSTGIVLTVDHGRLSLEDHYHDTYMNQVSDVDNDWVVVQEETLEDHYYATYMNQVADVEYDWVVLQEETNVTSMATYQPSEILYDLITVLDGSKTMFLMPWAYKEGHKGLTFQEQTANIMGNTGKLVEEAELLGLKAWMAPVGLAFEVVYLDCQLVLADSCLDLYQDDGMRANQNGKYLAALTTVAAMTGRDPVTIEFRPQVVPEEAAQTLRDASRRAILYTIFKNVAEYPWDTSEWATTNFTD